MATINSLAKKYAEYILLNSHNPNVVFEVSQKIKQISYTDSGEKLRDSDLEKLFDAIESLINPNEVRLKNGLRYVTESNDSSELIKLIQRIRADVKRK